MNQELLLDLDGGLLLTQLVPDIKEEVETIIMKIIIILETIHLIAELMNGLKEDLILGLLMYSLITTEKNAATLLSSIQKSRVLKCQECQDAGLQLTQLAQ